MVMNAQVSMEPSKSSESSTALENNGKTKTEKEAGKKNLSSMLETDGAGFRFAATGSTLLHSGCILGKTSNKDEEVNLKGSLKPEGHLDSERIIHEKNMEKTTEVMPSMSAEASFQGFASVQHHGTHFSFGCPNKSKVPGFPSICETASVPWSYHGEPIWQKKVRKEFSLDTLSRAESEIQLICSKQSCIHGIPSIIQPNEGHYRSNTEHWPSSHSELVNSIEIQARRESLRKELEKNCKSQVTQSLADTHTTENGSYNHDMAIINSESFPINSPSSNARFSCIDLTPTCPLTASIVGFPSKQTANGKSWMTIRPRWTDSETKQKPLPLMANALINEEQIRDARTAKIMSLLAPTCPQQARASGFPSYLDPLIVHQMPNTTKLLRLSPQLSKTPGLSSVAGNLSVEWVTEKSTLIRRPPEESVVVKYMPDNTAPMLSCPTVSNMPVLPSILNPQNFSSGLNVVKILPVCSRFTLIPGFASVVQCFEGGWLRAHGPLILRPQKKVDFMIYSAKVQFDKLKMFALVTSCPRASKVPGFPSNPQSSMLSLAQLCPKESSLLGFATIRNVPHVQWNLKTLNLCCDSIREESVILSPNIDGETVKKMSDIRPSCPVASKIYGYPSAPLTKSQLVFKMTSFAHCCTGTSRIEGFGSISLAQNQEWPQKTKSVWFKRQMRTTEIQPLMRQYQTHDYKVKEMLALVTVCPKEVRIYGFPTAQVVNRPPCMVSLYSSSPRSSNVPGFPSARKLSINFKDVPASTSSSDILFKMEVPHEDIVLVENKHQLSEEDMKSMVALVSLCPNFTGIHGLACLSQRNSTSTSENDGAYFGCFSAAKYTKEFLDSGVHSPPVNRLSTPSENGETKVISFNFNVFSCSVTHCT